MSTSKPKHPATFTESIMETMLDVLHKHCPPPAFVLDPFAGTGKIHRFVEYRTYGIEIEPEWAAIHPYTEVGDATSLPYADGLFDAIVTSPVYGNRMSDSHNAKDRSSRRSYTHDLREMTGDNGRTLAESNAGRMYAWNNEYLDLHRKAWAESARVLKREGIVILNTSDFVRGGEVFPLTELHINLWGWTGFKVVDRYQIDTPRMRHGANSEARVDHEDLTVLARRNTRRR